MRTIAVCSHQILSFNPWIVLDRFDPNLGVLSSLKRLINILVSAWGQVTLPNFGVLNFYTECWHLDVFVDVYKHFAPHFDASASSDHKGKRAFMNEQHLSIYHDHLVLFELKVGCCIQKAHQCVMDITLDWPCVVGIDYVAVWEGKHTPIKMSHSPFTKLRSNCQKRNMSRRFSVNEALALILDSDNDSETADSIEHNSEYNKWASVEENTQVQREVMLMEWDHSMATNPLCKPHRLKD